MIYNLSSARGVQFINFTFRRIQLRSFFIDWNFDGREMVGNLNFDGGEVTNIVY